MKMIKKASMQVNIYTHISLELPLTGDNKYSVKYRQLSKNMYTCKYIPVCRVPQDGASDKYPFQRSTGTSSSSSI